VGFDLAKQHEVVSLTVDRVAQTVAFGENLEKSGISLFTAASLLS